MEDKKVYNFKGSLNLKGELKNIKNPKVGDMYFIKYEFNENHILIDCKSCFVYDGKEFNPLEIHKDDIDENLKDSNIYNIDIISFIENICNIKLYEYQKILIRNYFSSNSK